jgi:hypothetical protein
MRECFPNAAKLGSNVAGSVSQISVYQPGTAFHVIRN